MEPAMTMDQTRDDAEIRIARNADDAVNDPSELVELFQVSHLRGCAYHFSIFQGRYLSVHSKKLARKPRRHWLDLGFLDPTPHFFAKTDRHSLYAAAGLMGITLILALVSLWSEAPWHQQAWLPAAVLTFSAALIAMLVFLYRSHSVVRFHSQNGDAVFLELLNNYPGRAAFNTYVRTLIDHIQEVHKAQRRKQQETLGAELREHRRLKEAGLLTEKAYDRARAKILRQHKQSQTQHAAAPSLPGPDSSEADVIEVTLRDGAWHTSG